MDKPDFTVFYKRCFCPQDERSQKMDVYPFLEKVFLERILGR